MTRELICQMCFYRAKSQRSLISHCLIRHRCDGNFIAYCNVEQCMYSTKSWNAFKVHYRRKHPGYLLNDIHSSKTLGHILGQGSEDCEYSNMCSDTSSVNGEYGENGHVNNDVLFLASKNQMLSKNYFFLLAKLFMSLETEHKISKKSVDNICASMTELLSTVVEKTVEKLECLLKDSPLEKGEKEKIISDLRDDVGDSIVQPCTLFSTPHSRQKVYENHCGLLPPQAVLMGHKICRKRGKAQRKGQFGYYIPVAKLLEKLLNLPEIWYYFKNPTQSADDVMRDVSDGRLVKNHPLNCDPDNFLKISLYYDDVEIQNPLRSSAKYKLGMFYMQLLNIPVAFRSQLSSIFLVAMCKSKLISKFGLTNILQDFIETMSVLRGTGLLVQVNGVEVKVKGALLFSLSDTPAAGIIAGYKEGSAFAHRPCRKCYADKQSMKLHFRSEHFQKRDMKSHLEECAQIEDPNMSKANKAFWSRTYGVNRLSPLCKIPGFDITKYILMDTMHIMSEGLTGQILALFLHKCIYELELFSLSWLNEQIRSYEYKSVTKGHIPEEISKHQLTVDINVKQKSVAMDTLLSILPHIVGGFFPLENDHYNHLITYVKINHLACSPYVKSETIVQLRDLIEKFCKGWVHLYPQVSLRPKSHFLIHVPDDMEEVGSLHALSCLRFESKHGWFKSIPLTNYQNISYSLAQKHQMYLCHKMLGINGEPNSNFIYRGDEISEGGILKVTCNSTDLFPLVCAELGPKNEFLLYETNKVNIRGLIYELGGILVIETDDLGHPLFGQIDNILVHDEIKYFFINECEALCYVAQYNSYRVKNTDGYRLMKWNDLSNKFPLSKKIIDGKHFVCHRYSEF